MEEKKVPMVPKYQAERDKVYHTKMTRYMLIAVALIVIGFSIFAVCMVKQANCMVKQADIFVTGYNSRTKDWLNTIRELQGSAAVTEVIDGYQADP